MRPPALLRWLLLAYPPALRREHGAEIAQAIVLDWRRRSSLGSRARLMGTVARDVAAIWLARRRQPGPSRDGRFGRLRHFFNGVRTDSRDIARSLTRAPLLAVGATVTLGLGIGAVTAIVSLADAALLRPLPIPEPDRVMQMRWSWAYPDVRDLAARQSVFTDVSAWATPTAGLDIGGRTESVQLGAVSSRYFALAGQQPLAGRLLEDGDGSRDVPIAVVLSERVWTRLFGRDASVIGRTFRINRRPVSVVGILPRRFRGFSLSESPEVFLPLGRLREIATGFLAQPGILTSQNASWLTVGGRLRPGVTQERAEAEVQTIYAQLHPPKGTETPARERAITPLVARALGLEESSDLRRFLFILIGATVLTLGLACATVANLLLVRAEGRGREFAMRVALGASRGRLARLLLGESLAIGVGGAGLALAVASGALALLGAFTLPGAISVAALDLSVNATVFRLALALGVLTSLVFGLAPLWPVARLPVTSTLRDGGRASARQPLRATLVAVQVALCVLLLGGGLVFGRAVRHALALDRGFDAEHTVLVTVAPAVARYDAAQKAALHGRVLARLQREPWVRAAAWSSLPPLSGRMVWTLGVPGYTPTQPDEMSLDANAVSEGFFDAMGIRIISGRAFDAADVEAAPRVTVVSDGFARKFWPVGEAVGRQVVLDPEAKPPVAATVVGVVGDVRRGLERQPDPTAYVPLAQHPGMLDFGQQRLVVRTVMDPDSAAKAASAVLHEVDPLVPVTSARPMRELVRAAAAAQRLGLLLFALFAGAAVVLTTFGVYAVVAYAIARRTREIGIRMALGARASGVLGLVVRQGLRPVGIGLALGGLAFYVSGRMLQAFAMALPVFGAGMLAALAAGVGAIALLAMIVPARRALSIDPARTLREP